MRYIRKKVYKKCSTWNKFLNYEQMFLYITKFFYIKEKKEPEKRSGS